MSIGSRSLRPKPRPRGERGAAGRFECANGPFTRPEGPMSVQDLSDEEFARRGNAIFEEQVLPQINDPNAKARHFVVIDIETGDYEVSDTPRTATDASQRLLDRRPEAMGRLWFRRVGSPTAHRVGGRFRPADRDGQ